MCLQRSQGEDGGVIFNPQIVLTVKFLLDKNFRLLDISSVCFAVAHFRNGIGLPVFTVI